MLGEGIRIFYTELVECKENFPVQNLRQKILWEFGSPLKTCEAWLDASEVKLPWGDHESLSRWSFLRESFDRERLLIHERLRHTFGFSCVSLYWQTSCRTQSISVSSIDIFFSPAFGIIILYNHIATFCDFLTSRYKLSNEKLCHNWYLFINHNLLFKQL